MAPAEPADLDPLLLRLTDPTPVTEPEVFPRGTLQPDGRLDLCKNSLGPLGAVRIIPAATASPLVTHLLLGTNTIGSTGAQALATALGSDNHGLSTLYLGCNHIDAAGFRPLAQRLATDTTVTALWIKRNPIGDKGIAALADALRRNTTLRTLDLINTGITLDGLADLVDALLTRAAPIRRLHMGGNFLGPAAAPLFASLLRDAGLDVLSLASSALGDDGVRALAASVRDLTGRGLTLGLGGNGVQIAGVRELAASLASIGSLDLARPPSARALGAVPNEVGDDGADALAQALPGSGLRRLDVRHTGVRGRGAKALLAAVTTAAEAGLSTVEEVGLGTGVPRRVKRDIGRHLCARSAPPADLQTVASVYR